MTRSRRRRSSRAGRRSAALLASLVLFVAGGVVHAHVGTRIYPIYELPTALLPDLHDGILQDWETVLPGISLDQDQFGPLPVGDGAGIDPTDLAYRVFMAWNSRAQRLWVAVERVDDVYINAYEGGDLINLWRFDSIEFMVDGDHSGGAYNGFFPDEWSPDERKLLTNYQAQQYVAIAEAPDGINIGYLGNGGGWVNRPPWADAGGFAAGEAPNTSVIELYVTPWDGCDWRGPEYSKRSALVVGGVIGFQISVPDFDARAGAYHSFHTLARQANTWRLAENFVDGVLIPCDTGDCGLSTFELRVRGPNADCGVDPPFDCTTLTIGLAAGATDGLDADLGEVEQPPLPPTTAIFDVRSLVSGIEGLRLDLRHSGASAPQWLIALQAGAGDQPVAFTWDRSALPSGPWRLRSQNGTQPIDVDMTTQDSVAITDTTVTRLEISRTAGVVTRTFTYGGGWSMISLPVTPASAELTTLFPNAISAFRFASGYQQVTTLGPCEGYWLNLPAGGGTYPLTGTPLAECSSSLGAGWSMIGVPTNGIAMANIGQSPPNSIISVFSFAGGYQQVTTNLPQGAGYWVNLRSAATLTMNASPTVVTKPVASLPGATGRGSRLLVRANGVEQAVFLGVPVEDLVALPPAPPVGVLDARAEVNGVAMNGVPVASQPTDYRLMIQGSDLELSWEIAVGDGQAWQLVVDGQAHDLTGNDGLTFAEAPSQLLLRSAARPLAFALHGNYPNPFNPTTTIRYALAQAGEVSLRVYAVTGQLVRELVSAWQPTGSYQVTWDGRDGAGAAVGSGIYLCELRAGDYRGVRRMVLLK